MDSPGRKTTLGLALAGAIAAGGSVVAQRVKIERCTPANLRAGEAVEIILAGGGLEGVDLWTSFPATIERVDEKAARFRITTDFAGAGAIRAHSSDGLSNLLFLRSESSGNWSRPSERRTRREEAQAIDLPVVLEGVSDQLAAHHYRFAATGGQSVVVQAEACGSDFDGVITIRSADNGSRLAQADDSDIYGADPWLRFVPPATGDYLIELIDSQYRGGQAYRLRVGGLAEARRAAQDPDVVEHEESAGEEGVDPIWKTTVWETIQGGFEAAGDADVFSFEVPRRTFVTITPQARALRSPVIPRLKLTNSEGVILAETPLDSFEELPLRLWMEKGDDYRLRIAEAFDRHGSDCRYRLVLDGAASPFELGIPRQKDGKQPLQDKFLAVPGGLIEVPVQCVRYQFDAAIDLWVESATACVAEDGLIGAKEGNANLRVRVPGQVAPGELLTVWVTGAATAGEEVHECQLRTREALAERERGTVIPEEVDGALAVRVVECPATVEVSPPGEVERGGAATIPVKLVWRDEGRKFNTTLRLAGLPAGAQADENKLNANDATTSLELKTGSAEAGELTDLRVEVRLDYYKQALVVESEPFTIRITESDEKRN